MASLVPATAKAIFETALGDHFDTFKAAITVHKEAKKTITLAASQNIYAGYSAPKETVAYTPVSKGFTAIVNYKENQPLDYQDELKEIGGSQFNVVSSEGARYFLGKTYYVYYLEATT